MSTPSPRTTRGYLLRLLGLLVASYALCIAAFVLYESVSRSSHWDGAMDGLFFLVVLVTVPWLVVLAPLTGAIYHVRRNREQGRVLLVLAPSVLVFFLVLHPLLTTPPTVANRFRRLTDHALPASAQEVRVFDTGGGFDGVETTFFFRCAPEDTEALIRALDLQLTPKDQPPYDKGPDATWPDPHLWAGRVFYCKERPFIETGPRLPGLNYYLCTDATRTQVWLAIIP